MANTSLSVPLVRSLRLISTRVASGMRGAGLALLGFGLLLGLWAVLAAISRDLPGPDKTFPVLWELLRNPFYDNGPNDKGIGIQVVLSLGRVFLGWGIGALIAIPVGILMGANRSVMQVLNPVVQLLRPVSPLAWFPIGLAVYQNAGKAVVFAIVITSLWPTLVNTMFGIASLPEDFRNVARVFHFSHFKYLSKVLLPYALPHILTGLRLSMGIAWVVIVAGEMLAGGTGIGFFVWDSWNAGSVERVLSGILVIGLIGLLLDRGLEWVARRVSFTH